jgi:glycyl-tRNA synthetase beta chain
MKANLLVELLADELPPANLEGLGRSFAEKLAAELAGPACRLVDADALVTSFASPRRLAAHIAGVLSVSPERSVAVRLMPVRVGLDSDGRATPALRKRLAALGETEDRVAQLRRVPDGKEEVLFLDQAQPGVQLASGLQAALTRAIEALPAPRTMSYQLADGITTVRFLRPAHGLVALHGAEIVPVSVLGLSAGRVTRGHRFAAKLPEIAIESADTYALQLREQGSVIASFAERRQNIREQITAAVAQLGEARAEADDTLLDAVTALVELPNVLVGEFDREFLDISPECLSLTMRTHQKCIPIFSGQQLTHRFLIVANVAPADPLPVILGNQRVIRARLADAKFFFEQDRSKPLESRLPRLSDVVYHAKLGSQKDRGARIAAIAVAIVELLKQPELLDPTRLAARLAKADLLTEMVGEFPELQGTMGSQYARLEGLPEEVCQAIEDHYRPRFAGDELPRGRVGMILALADKLEALVGMFGIGEVPTGNKDPFALRRHTIGAIRILIERHLPLELPRLLRATVESFGPLIADPTAAVSDFVYERLSFSLRESGFTPQQVDAVLCSRPALLADAVRRLEAVREFDRLTEAASLAAANKRVSNILKKADGRAPPVDRALFTEAAERDLFTALERVESAQSNALAAGDYVSSLRAVATLEGPVDAFFENVLVNTDDAAQRDNRLAILARLASVMNRVANISRLAI